MSRAKKMRATLSFTFCGAFPCVSSAQTTRRTLLFSGCGS